MAAKMSKKEQEEANKAFGIVLAVAIFLFLFCIKFVIDVFKIMLNALNKNKNRIYS